MRHGPETQDDETGKWKQFFRDHFSESVKPTTPIRVGREHAVCGFRTLGSRYILVAHTSKATHPIGKLWNLLKIRLLANKLRSNLKSRGYEVSVFAVYPTWERPFVIYDLHAPSSNYAQNMLLLKGKKNSLPAILLRSLIGCDPSINTFVTVGVAKESVH
jgi:hypothetical protein